MEKSGIQQLEKGLERSIQLLRRALENSKNGGDLEDVCKIALLGLALGSHVVNHFITVEELS